MKENGQEKIERLKREYQSIQIPEEARQRICLGIQRAKEEMEESGKKQKIEEMEESRKKQKIKEAMQKGIEKAEKEQRQESQGREDSNIITHIEKRRKETQRQALKIMIKKTGMTAAAALAAIVVLANSNAQIANAMERIPVIGAIAHVVTFREYKEENPNFEADVQIPQIAQENGQTLIANQSIQEYAQELIHSYETELKKSQGEGHYSLHSDYEVAFENEKYVCIRINTEIAMASGSSFVKVFTVDKETGEVISLLELLENKEGLLEKISTNIKEQMKNQMEEDENIYYYYQTEYPEDDFKGLTGEESYSFTEKKELVISFDEYEVAPGYMGAVSFVIPKEVTGDLIQ